MNILEAEDLVKGLPDQVLLQKAQQPDGQVPQFLYVSEVQRRADMRKRLQGQQQEQKGSIKDQILQGGIQSLGMGGPPGAVPRGTPQMNMPGAGSPPPMHGPSQMPAPPASNGMARGGVVRMALGGAVPVTVPMGDGSMITADVSKLGYANQADFLADWREQKVSLDQLQGAVMEDPMRRQTLRGPQPQVDAPVKPPGPLATENVTASAMPPGPGPAGLDSLINPKPVSYGTTSPGLEVMADPGVIAANGWNATRPGERRDELPPELRAVQQPLTEPQNNEPEGWLSRAYKATSRAIFPPDAVDKFMENPVSNLFLGGGFNTGLGMTLPDEKAKPPVPTTPEELDQILTALGVNESKAVAPEKAGQYAATEKVQAQGNIFKRYMDMVGTDYPEVPDMSDLVQQQKKDALAAAMVQLGAGVAAGDTAGGLSKAGTVAYGGMKEARDLEAKNKLLGYQGELGKQARDLDILGRGASIEANLQAARERIRSDIDRYALESLRQGHMDRRAAAAEVRRAVDARMEALSLILTPEELEKKRREIMNQELAYMSAMLGIDLNLGETSQRSQTSLTDLLKKKQ